MLLPYGMLVMVVDGGRMHLLRNDGSETRPKWSILEEAHQHVPPARELEAGPAGRTFDSSGPGRHSYGGADQHELREEAFARDALLKLSEHAKGNATAVLIAPPKLLGALRNAIDAPMRSHIVAEFAKDFTHQTPAEIEAFLRSQ